MSKCLVHARECVDFVDAYQNWKDQDCPWCRIRELETHIEKWVFVTALQTFEDRERFRTESEKLLYSATETKGDAT